MLIAKKFHKMIMLLGRGWTRQLCNDFMALRFIVHLHGVFMQNLFLIDVLYFPYLGTKEFNVVYKSPLT